MIRGLHSDFDLRREFPDWQVVTSPWARHKEGYPKAFEYIKKHRAEFAALDKEILAHWDSIKQPEWEYRHKVAFKNKVEAILADYLKRPLKLVITGSTVSGVGTANSDADITMCAPEIIHPLPRDYLEGTYQRLSIEEKRRRSGVVLRRCKTVLDEAHLGLKTEFVNAQIPLLKMVGTTFDEETGNEFQMEIDLSLVNDIFISSLQNSHLIRGYTRADARFAPLVTLVKKWSWTAGVRDPQRRRFNSYTMTLLVIHFLQCGLPRPVLPNLQAVYPEFYALSENESNFPTKVDLEADFPFPLPDLEGQPPIGLSVAELFYLFVAYYSSIDLHHWVIRIKCGRISRRGFTDHNFDMDQLNDDNTRFAPHRFRFHEVYIEDPIDEHNPGRTVDDWPAVRNCFADTLNVFNRIDDPDYTNDFGFPDLEDLTGMYD